MRSTNGRIGMSERTMVAVSIVQTWDFHYEDTVSFR